MARQDETRGDGGIAIIGLGGCFPGARDVSHFWENICEGHVAIREVPADRWDPDLYWSEDRSAPDRTYSRIGGFLDEVRFDKKRFRIPPRTLESVDDIQKLALTAVADALEDADLEVFSGRSEGGRAFNRERTAVILGNAMGGEFEDLTSLRVWYPSMVKAMEESGALDGVSPEKREALLSDMEARFKARLPKVTEDSMPGELSNCITGRIANAFDLRGPNYTTDAACAASLAAVNTAVQGLLLREYDVAIAGGVDRSMDPPTYAKFSKIGALSAEHSAPFDARANGFVMGEGAGVLILKRNEDAVADGDRVYARIVGIGAASDGKGKGMTAPNPRGQRAAILRAYQSAGVPLQSVGLFEAHGTSTVVGDGTELQVLTELLEESGVAPGATPIGSVKSMIGHLKSAAGAAALIKTVKALYHRKLPPSANYRSPVKDSPLHKGFLSVMNKTKEWGESDSPRRAGVSAFGFGGTNFHVVLEETVPSGSPSLKRDPVDSAVHTGQTNAPARAQGVAAGGLPNREALLGQIKQLFVEKTGYDLEELDPGYDLENDLGIDTVKQAEIFGIVRETYGLPQDEDFRLSAVQTISAIVSYVLSNTASESLGGGPEESLESPAIFVFGGESKEAVLKSAGATLQAGTSFSKELVAGRESAIGERVKLAFVASDLEEARAKVVDAGKRREKVLVAQGIFLNEQVEQEQEGKLAFLFPGQGSQYVNMFRDLADDYEIVADTFQEADRILEPLIGGSLISIVWPEEGDQNSPEAVERLKQTEICQPAMLAADVAMMRLLLSFGVAPDFVAGHSLGEYAACVASGVLSFEDALYAVSARGREMAEVKVVDNGKMATVAADATRVEEILGSVDGYVIAANKNCSSQTVIAGNSVAVEKALVQFSELKIDARPIPVSHAFHSAIVAPAAEPLGRVLRTLDIRGPELPILSNVHADYYPTTSEEISTLLAKQLESPVEFIAQVERLYAEGVRTFVEVGPRRAITGFVRNILGKRPHQAVATNHHKKSGMDGLTSALAALSSGGVKVCFEGKEEVCSPRAAPQQDIEQDAPLSSGKGGPVLSVSGVAVGLPTENPTGELHEDGFARILSGENFILEIPSDERDRIVGKNVQRLNKMTGEFDKLTDPSEVIQLAGRQGGVDLVGDYGVDAGLNDALDTTSRLAIAVGIDALRDAGLPLIRKYRTTSTGKQLADRWALPEELAKRTGIIFASAFPGLDRAIEDVSRQVASSYAGRTASDLRALIESYIERVGESKEAGELRSHFGSKIDQLETEADLYRFNRKFLFRVLALGHAQLAQVIGAKGPNTAVNAACASGTQALGVAADWVKLGRCDRVLIVSADDVTSEHNLPWIGAGFLASGAATVAGDVREAAVPFGAKRNGMILGSGATAFVVERDDLVAARGMEPVGEIIATHFSNSAFHGTRLDGKFIADVFTDFIDEVGEARGYDRGTLAKKTFFMSHETYTPARGGSSQTEIDAIRKAFGEHASEVLIANTKGYTGHPMGATIEDGVVLKGLQRGTLPAVANLRDIDPEFADLLFSDGGTMDREIGVRFAAGFGSQIAMVAYHRRAVSEGRLISDATYHRWLDQLCARTDAGLEVVDRTLRVAEEGGCRVSELGVPSLVQSVDGTREEGRREEVTPEVTPEVAPAMLPKDDELALAVRRLFSKETGYELEELDPDYQLEADLGIDTVKQAEIFSILRERYGLPRDEEFKLSEVQTLRAVVAYVESFSAPGRTDSIQRPEEALEAESPSTSGGLSRERVLLEVIELFAGQTGYDREELDPEYQLEADLGIDTVKQAEIFSMLRERYGMSSDESFNLSEVQTLHRVVDYVLGQLSASPGPRAESPLREDSASLASDSASSTSEFASPALDSTSPALDSSSPALDSSSPGPRAESPPREDSASLALEFASPALDSTSPILDSSSPALGSSSPALEREAGGERSAVGTRGASLDLRSELIALFASHTGYEPEELDGDYELEADLGIDTVKQAEIFSIIRERYGVPADEAFTLAEVSTLTALTNYVEARGTVLGASSESDAPGMETGEAEALTADGLIPELAELFSAQTGYEVEELEPDYALEEDLGIDTVKQAEILALIRKKYELPHSDDFKLSEVQTLNALAAYVLSHRPSASSSGGGVGAPAEEPLPSVGGLPLVAEAFVPSRVGCVEALPRGERTLDFEGRRVVVTGGSKELRSAFVRGLVNSGARVVELCSTVEGGDLESFLLSVPGGVPDDLLFLLNPAGLETSAALCFQVQRLFNLTRAFARTRPSMSDAGLLVAGRSPGAFGFWDSSLEGTALGAFAGVAKSLAKEWESSRCRAFDLDKSVADVHEVVGEALNEWGTPGPVEMAFKDGKRLSLQRVSSIPEQERGGLSPEVVVVTGGTRGVTFEILKVLAERNPLKLVLLARTPGVTPAKSPIYEVTPKEQKEIATRALRERGARTTPAAVRGWIAREERRLQIEENLGALRELGCEVELIPCDVGDLEDLVRVTETIGSRYPRVDLLIHGAGLEESRLLKDKDLEAFRRVFMPKAAAAMTLWSGLGPERTLMMGSVAGRFGNGGQVDYAAANELMAAYARLPQRRILNVNWTAWGDVGMATRGSVKTVLEASGVELLPAKVGALVGASLAASELSGDVVVAGALGQFSAPEQVNPVLYEGPEALPSLFESQEVFKEGARYFRELRVEAEPGLNDHRVEGTPVLPGVLGVELMVAAATHYAGAQIRELQNVRFDSPVKLYRDRPLATAVEVRAGDGDWFEITLVSYFEKPSGKVVRREHFSADAYPGVREDGRARKETPLELPRDPRIEQGDIYKRYFHGPAFQVIRSVELLGEDGVEVLPIKESPPWIDAYDHSRFISSPLLREVGFQAAGLWEMAELGRMALPSGVERIILRDLKAPAAELRVSVRRVAGGRFDVWTSDAEGRCYDRMFGYHTETLRTLTEEERFEPVRSAVETPLWSVMELEEVATLLEQDTESTLKRFLSDKEVARFKELKLKKRRTEWLAGRVVAKRLIREERFGREGAIIPYSAITILPDRLGAPRVRVVGEAAEPLLISISHSAGVAAAFKSLDRRLAPGIDVEGIEVRDESFERTYFNTGELRLVEEADDREAMLTTLWAIKEALLKCLGIGARVDLRDLTVSLGSGGWSVEFKGEAAKRGLELGAGTPTIDVEREGPRVFARALLPVDLGERGREGATFTPEATA